LRARWSGDTDWHADAREVDEVLSLLRAGSQSGSVASTNPALLYLRTGRRGVYLPLTESGLAPLREIGVRYLAALQPIPMPGLTGDERLIGRTSRRGLWVIENLDGHHVHLTQSASAH